MKTAYITWEFRPFYRRWQGWNRLFWWLGPIRWALVTIEENVKSYSYNVSANDAAMELLRECRGEGWTLTYGFHRTLVVFRSKS